MSHQPHPTIVSQYESHRGGVHAVRFRPQMKHLVLGGSDCAVYLWSLHCRPNLRDPVVRPYRFLGHNPLGRKTEVYVCGYPQLIKGHTGPVRSVNFNHDGRFLLSGSDDKTIKVHGIQRLVLDCRLILSGSDDKSIRLWDVEKHECVQQFQDVLGMVNSVRFHPDNSCVPNGNSDHCIQMWDIRSKNLIQHYAAKIQIVFTLQGHDGATQAA
ncbi:hypothetical protein R1flu_015985 [Riccia fluitans]|uniref:Uncharacterized protein n=1 Tax=Riccia fluitans TaxID=41844 RepID=A0ABD1YNP1_9MARC